MSDTSHQQPSPDAGFEQTDASVPAILRFGVILVALLVFSTVVAWWSFKVLKARAERNDPKVSALAAADSPEPPEPRLLQHEHEDLLSVREQEQEVLNSYGWVDKEKGVVRIPIARALELVAEAGLPTRPAASKAP